MDACATTPRAPEVREAMEPWLSPEAVGNPSSPHAAGRRARAALDTAREQVAAAVGAAPREVHFVSGGTEADGLALAGSWRDPARGPHRNRIVVSAIEHPAVLRTAATLRAEGARVDLAPVDSDGRVRPGAVEELLDEDVLLVSVMLVNNETGVVQDVEGIARLVRAAGALLHVDAVQAPTRLPLDLTELAADLVSLSSHKVHGPTGAGALVIRGEAAPAPLLQGGGQERGRRPGTEPVAALVGMGAAYARIGRSGAEDRARLQDLDRRLVDGLSARGARIHGAPEHRAPGIASASFPGCDGETLLMALDLAGFQVSTGAACASGAREPSPVLTAMGLPEEEVRGALRISLSRENTTEEVDALAAALPEILSRVRSSGEAAA